MQNVVFQTIRCESKKENKIAFKVQTSLLLKALKVAVAHGALSLGFKLSERTVLSGTEGIRRAMLVFQGECDGNVADLCHQLPISQPIRGPEIEQLFTLLDVQDLCPFYVDVLPALHQITVCFIISLQ